jgi:hypothetical protein
MICKHTRLITTLMGAALLTGSASLEASTIDTFDFTQNGWDVSGYTGVLTGSFAGTVEADGFIEAQEVSSFSAQLALSNGEMIFYHYLAPLATGEPPFFSYAVNGGASSLDFIAANGVTPNLCEGAAAPLACGSLGTDFGFVAGFGGTMDQGTLTLVSSVTSAPVTSAPTTAAPEPGSVSVAGLGFLLLGFGAFVRWEFVGKDTFSWRSTFRW